MVPQQDGYSRLSIALHWIAAVAVIALFFTHEGDRGSAQYAFHVGGGAILGVLIVWRALRRPFRGFPAKPDQPAILNLISTIVLWALLAAMVITVVTGYFLPWSLGAPIDLFSMAEIPSPMSRSRDLHEAMEEIHEIAGQAILPLVVLHVLGALKHAIIDKDGVMQRMSKAIGGGH
ncbi:MAG: cytochrome b/b6 domain-containing protein [Nitratireductor sp.]|nr:cytochrome b/b6 domain-containing protein [Nitratireductor sp.]